MRQSTESLPDFTPRIDSGIHNETSATEIVDQLQNYYCSCLQSSVKGYFTPVQDVWFFRFVGYNHLLLFNAAVYTRIRTDTGSGLAFQPWDASIADIVLKKKNHGHGTRIVRAFLTGMQCIGVHRVLLAVTDADAANGAIRFWERQGFKALGERTHMGTVMELGIRHRDQSQS